MLHDIAVHVVECPQNNKDWISFFKAFHYSLNANVPSRIFLVMFEVFLQRSPSPFDESFKISDLVTKLNCEKIPLVYEQKEIDIYSEKCSEIKFSGKSEQIKCI